MMHVVDMDSAMSPNYPCQDGPLAKPSNAGSSVTPHQLCDRCSTVVRKSSVLQECFRRLDEGDQRRQDWRRCEIFYHSGGLEELAKSSQTGCHICTIVHESLTRSAPPIREHGPVLVKVGIEPLQDEIIDNDSLSMRFGILQVGKWKYYRVQAGWKEEDGTALIYTGGPLEADHLFRYGCTRHHTVNLSILLLNDTHFLFPKEARGYQMSRGSSTDAPETFGFARRWLEECTYNHAECNHHGQQISKSDALPTRLIDIGAGPGDLEPRLFYPSASASPTDLKYLTVSHSWHATGVTEKLTTENESQWLHSIPLEKLSPNFRDAMTITRRLGYRYLWIDSLCIIQDSREDWEREVPTMTNVYGRTTCNIAMVGQAGHEGCFRQRNPLVAFPCRLYESDGKPNRLYAFIEGSTRKFSRGPDEIIGSFPLLRRGWVVQETLLAPRTIFFGDQEVYFHCTKQTMSESWPVAIDPLIRHFNPRFLGFSKVRGFREFGQIFEQSWKEKFKGIQLDIKDERRAAMAAKNFLKRSRQLRAMWNRFLLYYTDTSLTFTTDRLAAVVGLAEAVENYTGLTYIPQAGTFKEFLPLELIWYRNFRSVDLLWRKSPTGTNAPSWSWAANEGDVLFDEKSWLEGSHDDFEYMALFKEVIIPPTPSTSSPGSGSQVVIKLKTLINRQTALGLGMREPPGFWINYLPKAQLQVVMDEPVKDGTTIIFIVVLRTRTWNNNGYDKHVSGLILVEKDPAEAPGAQEAVGQGQPLHRRVGYFRIAEPANVSGILDFFAGCPKKDICIC
ncbi:heterokaryon incompatibility protein-domain-containing protein [Sordaria brevicollis]|uniref:Heterokaryon incompatibility protein-domain-containing protein n=1 Tax=Sordaria brevicollis TaxID=83679 RepID=A0AAE0PEH4_SORBR|nr:heterokaryon incompatibility protein-domain-containing protein [Sordaria brevicollis]